LERILFANGKVACITVAGGQGTRLGFSGPKGSYEIDVPPKKSLFEFVCDNLKRSNEKYSVEIPWYIMTSSYNDANTKKFFEDKNFFDYNRNLVHFFMQSSLPVIDINSNVILDTTFRVKEGSNGNGDVFRAFDKAGFNLELEKLGIEWIFVAGIDNILQKTIDSLFLGLTSHGNYQVASKSLSKSDFSSADWVFANVKGRPCIIDPTNLSIADIYKTNSEGKYLYNQTNMLSHLFSAEAFKSLADVNLPYHRAFKKSDFINEEGMKQVAEKPNSFKFEKFIFDAFKEFDKLLLLQVNPKEEFAPIKSFTGNATPETALALYKNYYKL
jgi:UDP-N-acetylglucosamine pyrophosphorylase